MTDPHDFLAVDGLLSEEDRAIRDTVRAFADKELAPHVADWYEQGTLPDDLGPKLGELGLLGMHLEGYGCAGTSATAYGVACRELEAVDSGLRSFVSVQGSLAMYAIHRWGTDTHKDEWLSRMSFSSSESRKSVSSRSSGLRVCSTDASAVVLMDAL